MKEKINKFFKIKENNSSIKIEVLAGITTFLAMAYILTVNPSNILWNGASDPRFGGVFIATSIGAFIGTLAMSLIAKMPFAQAPGMGLNAMVGTIIGGGLGFGFSYGNAMLLVFISGIIFLLLSILPGGYDEKEKRKVSLREKIFEGMPEVIRKAIPVGIGLFITFIGLQNAHLVTSNNFTLLELIDFNDPSLYQVGGPALGAIVTLFGLTVIGILSHFKVKGSVIIGILLASVLSIPLGIADLDILFGRELVTWRFWENIGNYFSSDGVFLSLFKEGLNFPSGSFFTSLMLVLTFCMIDLFDTIGTIVGCSMDAKLVNEDGKPLNYDKIMYSDSIAAIGASIVGTSSVTTFVESGTGISAGGRTGLTSLTTAVLFLSSIFLLPLFAFIPSEASACALIYVGVLMMKNVLHIDFSSIKNSLPAFLTIIIMPFAYSITDGIGLGVISYVVINGIIYIIELNKYEKGLIKEKPTCDITMVTLIVMFLFLIYFLMPTI